MIFVTPHPAEKLQYFFGVFLQFQIGVDINEGEKRRIQFVISGGDPTKPFKLLEEAFNQMALFI